MNHSTSIVVNVEGWTLSRFDTDEEPRVRDLDLAERLGYERPRDVRDLIKRLVSDGKLGEVFCRTAPQNGRGRPSTEFWLTEAQALKVTAKSETAKADALLDEIIRVFMLARRGLLPQQQLADSRIASIIESQTKTIDLLASRMTAIETIVSKLSASTANDTGIVGEEWAREHVHARLRRIANLMVGASQNAKLSREAMRHHRATSNRIANLFGYGGRGSSWKNFPKGPMVRGLIAQLEAAEEDAIKASRTLPDPRQIKLRSVS
jgi:hypothetical protein